MGIGSDFARGAQIDFVLGEFTPEEKTLIDEAIATAQDIIRSFVLAGVNITMNQFNKRRIAATKGTGKTGDSGISGESGGSGISTKEP